MKAEQQQFHEGLPFETKKDLSVWKTLGTLGDLSHFGEARRQSFCRVIIFYPVGEENHFEFLRQLDQF
jgi:hypothetical protein